MSCKKTGVSLFTDQIFFLTSFHDAFLSCASLKNFIYIPNALIRNYSYLNNKTKLEYIKELSSIEEKTLLGESI